MHRLEGVCTPPLIPPVYFVSRWWFLRYCPDETPRTRRNTVPNALSDAYPTAEAIAASVKGRCSRSILATWTPGGPVLEPSRRALVGDKGAITSDASAHSVKTPWFP